jgi:hypothetical protein
MRTLLTLFTIVSIFTLMSCSNVDQDLSPVGPEISKISVTEATGTYPYLQLFNSCPVESYTVFGNDVIEIVVGDEGWPEALEHIYVILEYESEIHPSAERMVYLEKPRTVTFQIEGFRTTGLKAVKVYYYALFTDPGIQNPYLPLQSFNDVEMQWSANDEEIQILLNDNFGDLGDSFAEITTTDGSFAVFVDKPNSKEILIPKYGKPVTTGVKLFSMQNFYRMQN